MAVFEKLMRQAFKLAEKGLGYTSPNPPVGAIILNGGEVIAKGYHRRFGAPHAEIEALRKAGDKSRNATIITTLEPCSHFGKTPPCADALIESGINKVVSAIEDPNPMVSGNGFKRLKEAGIEVVNGVGKSCAESFYRPYFKFITTGIPYVTVKFAQSVDGRIATATGHSRWISSPDSLKFAHKLRAVNDAILVGANTLDRDDPLLTTRLVKGASPIRIVLTGSGRLNFKSKLFKDNSTRTFIAVGRDSGIKPKNNYEIIYLRKQSGALSLWDLLKKLGRIGIMTLLVEGGSEVITSFLKQKLVDKVFICLAPFMIGEGLNSTGDLGIKKISGAIGFEEIEWRKSGPDMIWSGRPVWK
ncbi:MAG: bifunctional diaminohydroxyphosphoribosylaminopyrimidine deaminase/5-amino-6-(5-phosphoribosylamino)uracil reductase RibD [Candidatus Zixiibacteriota bacterium]|nr:MAG: bifunctional diaminohydroxyphosphoribosylaminopyrimidine deaminase/5-amino-6-(5-phosphoribosylamino)uracil reductase RibD [candidate division Zixibacteria bacterium]